jgi:hypothetical protein
MRNRAEPAAEALRGVVDELPHLRGQHEERILRDVLGVGLLQSSMPTPLKEQPTVAIHEFVPGRWVGRILAQPRQERRIRTRLATIFHPGKFLSSGKRRGVREKNHTVKGSRASTVITVC